MKKHKKRDAVGKKISILRNEDVPRDQAVAEALNMQREGRLTKSGGYKRVGRKGKRGSKRT